MYRILIGNHVIYDTQNKDDYPVSSPTLNLAVKDAGSLEFTAHSDHPYYDEIKTPLSIVTVYRDSDEIFYGRIIDYTTDMFGSLQVHCEGATTFLIDSEQGKLNKTTETVTAFFTRCINAHNAQVETAKQFTVGTVSVEKASTQQEFEITKFQKTKDAIESQLINRFGGFLRVRPNANGPHYIDYIESYNHTNNQLIQIGHNIIDKSDKASGESIFTIFRPIGKNDLTIGTLSQSDVQIPNCTKDGDTLRLTDLISEYGSIVDTKSFDTISDKTALLREAESYITKRRSHLPATSDIKFVDFYHLNPSIMAVSVGDSFSNIEGFSGQTLIASELELDLEDPSNDSIFFQNQEEFENQGKGNYTSASSGSRGGGGSGYAGQMFEHISDVDDKVTITAKETQIIGEQVTLHASELLQLSGEVTQITGGHIGIVTGKFIVDDQGNLKLEDGAALQIAKDHVYSDVVDQNGLASYVDQEIDRITQGIVGEITESVVEQTESYVLTQVRTKSKVYRQWADPAADPTIRAQLNDGDIWIKDNDLRKWGDLQRNTWNSAKIYNWDDYYGNEQRVWRSAINDWVLMNSWKDSVKNSIAVKQHQEEIEIIGEKQDQYETEWHIGIEALDVKYRDKTNQLDSHITVTALQLTSTFTDQANNLQSKITQNANSISLVVDDTTGKIKAAQIVAAINNGESSILISANKINLDGYVKATDITVDFLKAKIADIPVLEGINAKFVGNVMIDSYVRAPSFYIGASGTGNGRDLCNGIYAINLSGPSNNIYTLQYQTYRDSAWQDVGSFSRAVTSWSGSWGSGKITVSVSPQGQSHSFTLPDGSTWRRVWDDIQGFYIYYCTVAGKQYSHVFD